VSAVMAYNILEQALYSTVNSRADCRIKMTVRPALNKAEDRL